MIRTRALILGLSVPAVVAASVAVAGPVTGSQGASHAVGTWQMTIDIQPFLSPNGQVDPPPFPSLIALNRGGTMAESVSSVPGLAKNLLGANEAAGGLGTWAKHGSDYTFTFKKFLMADGALVGWQVVQATGSADSTSTTQDATAKFYNAAGVQVGPTLTVKATGTRMAP